MSTRQRMPHIHTGPYTVCAKTQQRHSDQVWNACKTKRLPHQCHTPMSPPPDHSTASKETLCACTSPATRGSNEHGGRKGCGGQYRRLGRALLILPRGDSDDNAKDEALSNELCSCAQCLVLQRRSRRVLLRVLSLSESPCVCAQTTRGAHVEHMIMLTIKDISRSFPSSSTCIISIIVYMQARADAPTRARACGQEERPAPC